MIHHAILYGKQFGFRFDLASNSLKKIKTTKKQKNMALSSSFI